MGTGVNTSGKIHKSMIQSLGTHAKISRKITAVTTSAVIVMLMTGCIPMARRREAEHAEGGRR